MIQTLVRTGALMTKDQAETFAKQFNKSFVPPLIPEGFVKCSTFEYKGETSIEFEIGDRSVGFKVTSDGLSWYGQDVRCDPNWLIERIKWN